MLWQEYRQVHPEGYRYSWFWERYQQWRRRLDVVLRQEHKAGEKVFVDWVGRGESMRKKRNPPREENDEKKE